MERLKDIKIGRRGFLGILGVGGTGIVASSVVGCGAIVPEQVRNLVGIGGGAVEGTPIPAGTPATRPTVAPTAAPRLTEGQPIVVPTVAATPKSEGTVVSAGTAIVTPTAKSAEGTPVPVATLNTERKSSVGIKVVVPGSHGVVPVADLDATTPQRTWIRPIYDKFQADAKHDWRGIGPWVPVFFDSDPGAAHLKTYGDVGLVVIVGDKGGKVRFGVWQEAQHDKEAIRRGDGMLDPNWKLQYTFHGLVPGTEIIPFDPDTGVQLKWDDGVTPIVYKANELGTFSVELPSGEVRVGLEFDTPGQKPGVQNPEVEIKRGPNDQPGLTGENKLPKSVSKPVMPD